MTVAAHVLLWLGVAVLLLSTLGVVVFPDPLDRLHFVTPAGSVAAPLIAVALILAAPDPHTAIKDGLTAVVLAVFGPVVGSATARAHRTRCGHRPGDVSDEVAAE